MGISIISNIVRETCEVDGKHIRLECPKNIQLQTFFSLILMAICDSNYCFRIINFGAYGKSSDCNVFKMSPFGKKLYSNKVNFPPKRCLSGDDQGVPQPFILLADEAFALNKNLL
ncbi:putative nuclease HARBI1 [Aphis craccivora]|uniref:Putative nuclease HARBI1 n=1 Tax=Aphis craccivora TaxID=307492 RepID=A0A6G0YLK8_APHCR|nr:putative nuclease HARBI1 [Aphis craccivora]